MIETHTHKVTREMQQEHILKKETKRTSPRKIINDPISTEKRKLKHIFKTIKRTTHKGNEETITSCTHLSDSTKTSEGDIRNEVRNAKLYFFGKCSQKVPNFLHSIDNMSNN